ncbi:MAG: hypothetical protein ABSB49_02355 [Polyangia bacterium]|jgi:hypothetical protein
MVVDDKPDGLDPEIVRAEAEIERARESVAESLSALQREISRTLDWRGWIRRRPIIAVAAAFAVGALLGSAGASRRKRR